MSERLSRLGRRGAEEVTDAIGGCFAELLAVAYGAGGGLLKFGGDALLLAFVGDGHALRAVWSAAAMRERLRQAGRLKTSAGNVTLRMSVGAHTGTRVRTGAANGTKPSRCTSARAALERAGATVDAAASSANIAEVLSDQGRFDEAESHLRDALRVSTAASYHLGTAGDGGLPRPQLRPGRSLRRRVLVPRLVA